MENVMSELIAHAAQLVVEEGLDYGQAKRRAVEQVGGGRRLAWPDNDALEEAVFEHLRLFHADTQPTELVGLRKTALEWMKKLQDFNPHLVGAVWRGTATRLSPIHVNLYCEDPKSAEWQLLDMGVSFELASTQTSQDQSVDVLLTWAWCEDLNQEVALLLTVLDRDDVRGALKPDARGKTRMGGVKSLQNLLEFVHE
ncbi:MAG: hypothetical protein RL307_666 [Pseudomonadota bacterium]